MLYLGVALVLLGIAAQPWDDADYPAPARHGEDDVDFDDYSDEEDIIPSITLTTHGTHTRVRRYDPASVARTLSEEEIRDVKGVLKDMMSGRNLFQMTSTVTMAAVSRLTSLVQQVTRSPAFTGLTMPSRSSVTTTRSSVDPTKFYENIIEEIIDHARKQGEVGTATKGTSSENAIEGYLEDVVETSKPLRQGYPDDDSTSMNPESGMYSRPDASDQNNTTAEQAGDAGDQTKRITELDKESTTDFNWGDDETTTKRKVPECETKFDNITKYTRKTRRKTTTTTPPKEIIDIETLVEIIANLTLDYELINITDLFNKTLLKYNIPKCLAPESTTLSTTVSTEEPTYDLVNATIISKCFVCGLEEYGIPRHAHCADAFAGDFLPLTPVDPQAKGQLARYRKYCRFLDIPGVLTNESQPRSVYGRWTGGCSVRWIDLSGVYTQRACRNRRHAVMGRHFVSKRMAKLEMALAKEDAGCIISPMSSLVPLSRGISLYARFHACVCTGNWCNMAPDKLPAYAMMVAMVALIQSV